jgi:hypothetical protein
MNRTPLVGTGFAALLMAVVAASACSSANNPGTTGSAGTGGGSAGTTGAGGSTGTAGTTGTGGTGADPFSLPDCGAIKDGDPCTAGAADCRKTCGVQASVTGAAKPCKCLVGAGSAVWECGASVGMCTYPATTDLTCYKLPAGTPPACPANTQSGKTTCDTMCSICSGYVDSGGAPKTGYCSCSGSAMDGGVTSMVYQCASTTEWPPQNR